MKRFLDSSVSDVPAPPEDPREKRQRAREQMEQEMGEQHLNVINRLDQDKNIQFIEDGHYYVDGAGKRFRYSCTGFLSLFCYPYDESATMKMKFQNPMWSDEKRAYVVGRSNLGIEKYPNKFPEDYGLTRKESLEKMRAKSTFGTEMHAKIEAYINRQGPGNFMGCTDEYRLIQMVGTNCNLQELNCARQVLQVENDYLRAKERPWRTELSIGSSRLLLAGQVDCVLERVNASGAKELVILDWKTTTHEPKKLWGWKPKEDRWGLDKSVLPWPLSDMPNNNASKYFLQMSLYAYIMRDLGLNVVEIRAIVLNPTKSYPTVIKSKPLFDQIELLVTKWNEYLKLEKDIMQWEKDSTFRPHYLPSQTHPVFFSQKSV